jgi:hypothetical protein
MQAPSDTFPVPSGTKQGESFSPLLFNFLVEYALRKVQDHPVGLKLNCSHQLMVYAFDVNLT